MVDLFDARGVTFVSVTQQFNTTTSMGRLTLNILLSFAQFEREVTGERIRDKIAASKAKGMWMGGTPPLGYDVRERKLVVNQSEAVLVRDIFARYAETGSAAQLVRELQVEGHTTKVWRTPQLVAGQCSCLGLRRGTRSPTPETQKPIAMDGLLNVLVAGAPS